jgi:uncharacterized protein with HEPN domain
MDRKIKLFTDIITAISLIQEFLGPINLFEDYSVDLKTKSAIERQLGIIGEAVKKIKDIDPNEPVTAHSDIIGLRNIIIHGYDTVDDNIVWSVIKEDLDVLKNEVLEKLQSE